MATSGKRFPPKAHGARDLKSSEGVEQQTTDKRHRLARSAPRPVDPARAGRTPGKTHVETGRHSPARQMGKAGTARARASLLFLGARFWRQAGELAKVFKIHMGATAHEQKAIEQTAKVAQTSTRTRLRTRRPLLPDKWGV